ncbi:MAG: hypothetical protein MUF79_13455, partial [Burkholderiales bacterium]|jgi:hypothetical protein|nr:hypothetical protein [Burkholderiales bacterium]
MGIFNWSRRVEPLASGVPEDRLRAAVEYLVDRVNPRLRMVRRYRERLLPAVDAAIARTRRIVEALPPAHDATPAQWAKDPCLRAFFAKAEDIPAAFGRAKEVAEFFAAHPSADFVLAVLGAQLEERQVFGAALHGDAVRQDVAQTTLSFTDYRVRMLGADEPELRRSIVQRIFDEFIVQILARLSAADARHQDLVKERSVLAAQLRALEAEQAGLAAALGDVRRRDERRRALQSALERRDAKLAGEGGGIELLERVLDALCDALAKPGEVITVGSRRVRLTRMNVIATPEITEPADEIEFGTASAAGAPPRAFLLVRFPRADYRPRGLDFEAAAGFVI